MAKAINHLKKGKADGNKGLISDHVKHSTKRMQLVISLLLTASTKHGHMPEDTLLSSISSIPKDSRASLCDSDNYRGIALSSCLAKIHDIIILNKYSAELCTSEMQYAFKSKHGTVMCTLALKEVTRYYQRCGSDVYVGMIDASKAFDRIRHDKLFLTLIDRKLPAIVIRIMLDSYQRQKMRTVWNGMYSENFGTLNGIKQGSIASPVLFTVYMDELLLRLEDSGIGCKVGSHYFGSIGYADDLSLVCPTLQGFQKMITICECFGDEYGVKYNPVKSVALHMTKKNSSTPPEVKLAGQPIKWVKTAKHLGNYIRSDFRETDEVAHKRGDFIGRVNNLSATFAKADDNVKRMIFNSQCSHLYGIETWNMADNDVEKFRKTWNLGVRKVFELPYQTHTRFLSLFLDRPYVTDQMNTRFYKLLMNMTNSDNKRISFLGKYMLADVSSIICQNMDKICQRYDFNFYARINGFNLQHFKCDIPDGDMQIVAQVMELRDTLKGKFNIESFSNEEIQCMIQS